MASEPGATFAPPAKRDAKSFSADLITQPTGIRASFAKSVSDFLPNFHFLDFVISQTDISLKFSNYFAREFSDIYWTHDAKIYYFVLTWYLILKRMQREGITSVDQNDFVTLFETNVDIPNLSIDGIVASFFMELNAASPHDSRYGPVIPWLPTIANNLFAQQTGYAWNDEYVQCLPNMVALFRMARRFNIGIGGQNQNNYTTYWNLTDETAPPAAIAQVQLGEGNTRITQLALISPGTAHLPAETNVDYNRIRARNLAPQIVSYPARPNNAQYANEMQWFRMEHRAKWFNELARLMTRRNRYIQGTDLFAKFISGACPTPLFRAITAEDETIETSLIHRAHEWYYEDVNVPVHLIGPGLPYVQGDQDTRLNLITLHNIPFDLAAFTAHVFQPGYTNDWFNCTLETSEGELTEVDYIRAFAALWCLRPRNILLHMNHDDYAQNHEHGHFWSRHITSTSAPVDPSDQLMQIISQKWMITKPTDTKL